MRQSASAACCGGCAARRRSAAPRGGARRACTASCRDWCGGRRRTRGGVRTCAGRCRTAPSGRARRAGGGGRSAPRRRRRRPDSDERRAAMHAALRLLQAARRALRRRRAARSSRRRALRGGGRRGRRGPQVVEQVPGGGCLGVGQRREHHRGGPVGQAQEGDAALAEHGVEGAQHAAGGPVRGLAGGAPADDGRSAAGSIDREAQHARRAEALLLQPDPQVPGGAASPARMSRSRPRRTPPPHLQLVALRSRSSVTSCCRNSSEAPAKSVGSPPRDDRGRAPARRGP